MERLLFVVVLFFTVSPILAMSGNGSLQNCLLQRKNSPSTQFVCRSRNLSEVPLFAQHNLLSPSSFLNLIDLSDNRIAHLSMEPFLGLNAHLSTARTLNLDDNDLSTIPSGVLQLFDRLEVLSVQNNQLQFRFLDQRGPLAVLPSTLKRLYLSGNPLGLLKEHVFYHLRNLEVLHINNATARHDAKKMRPLELAPGVFRYFRHLQELQLSQNHLTSLSEKHEPDFYQMTQLRSLSLAHNPLICDCRLLWLRRWLEWRKTNLALDNFSGNCGNVFNLPRVGDSAIKPNLTTLMLVDFQCAPTLLQPSSDHVEIIPLRKSQNGASLNISLRCQFSVFPKSSVIWMKNGHEIPESLTKAKATSLSHDNYTFWSSLELVHVTKEKDFGEYECYMRNKRGFVMGRFKVAFLETSPIRKPEDNTDVELYVKVILAVYCIWAGLLVVLVFHISSVTRFLSISRVWYRTTSPENIHEGNHDEVLNSSDESVSISLYQHVREDLQQESEFLYCLLMSQYPVECAEEETPLNL